MRVLSDKWNPRLWLREWLNQPSKAELVERQVAEAAAAQMFTVLANEYGVKPQYSLELDCSARINGLRRPVRHRESTR